LGKFCRKKENFKNWEIFVVEKGTKFVPKKIIGWLLSNIILGKVNNWVCGGNLLQLCLPKMGRPL
jgi:hypothetical protein